MSDYDSRRTQILSFFAELPIGTRVGITLNPRYELVTQGNSRRTKRVGFADRHVDNPISLTGRFVSYDGEITVQVHEENYPRLAPVSLWPSEIADFAELPELI
ncbi:MAG: hypothetical protein ACP5NS_03575 [Candidatus Pacearchaeota archaeon]